MLITYLLETAPGHAAAGLRGAVGVGANPPDAHVHHPGPGVLNAELGRFTAVVRSIARSRVATCVEALLPVHVNHPLSRVFGAENRDFCPAYAVGRSLAAALEVAASLADDIHHPVFGVLAAKPRRFGAVDAESRPRGATLWVPAGAAPHVDHPIASMLKAELRGLAPDDAVIRQLRATFVVAFLAAHDHPVHGVFRAKLPFFLARIIAVARPPPATRRVPAQLDSSGSHTSRGVLSAELHLSVADHTVGRLIGTILLVGAPRHANVYHAFLGVLDAEVRPLAPLHTEACGRGARLMAALP